MSSEANNTITEVPHNDLLGSLGINLNSFAGQLLNFSIVVLVMWLFVYKPLVKKMDEREKKIREGLAFSKDAAREREQAVEEKECLIQEARAEAHAILDAAKLRAGELHAEKIRQAKIEIERIIEEAKMQIRDEREASFLALKSEIAGLVALFTAKVAGKMEDKDQHALILDAIAQVEKT